MLVACFYNGRHHISRMAPRFAVTLVLIFMVAAPLRAWEYTITSDDNRLLVRPNSQSTWGTVCDDGFGSADATVACRSVFPGRTILSALYSTARSASPYASLPIRMDDVRCAGTEQHLAQCRFNSRHDCNHREDILLRCDVRPSASVGTSTPFAPAPSPSSASQPRGWIIGVAVGCGAAVAVALVAAVCAFRWLRARRADRFRRAPATDTEPFEVCVVPPSDLMTSDCVVLPTCSSAKEENDELDASVPSYWPQDDDVACGVVVTPHSMEPYHDGRQ
jgi:hypothetical protein